MHLETSYDTSTARASNNDSLAEETIFYLHLKTRKPFALPRYLHDFAYGSETYDRTPHKKLILFILGR